MKRTQNSLYNIIGNYIVFFTKTILMFVVRSVLIEKVSQTYVGLNGLFTNILSILSLAELGIGSAIGFSLYKPLNDKNNSKVNELMSFYKKAYKTIGIVIFCIGLAIIPILPFIVKEKISYMTIIYLLFLINTCSLYFISYKDVLITADQKAYKLTKINMIFTILISLGELCVLHFTSNFIGYLIIQFLLNIMQRIAINIYISRVYPDIDFKSNLKLEESTKNDVQKNVKAMFLHKIGDCMINATDNIIISSFININVVSVYSNYLLVTSYLTTFANMIYNGILASLGNFIINENNERKHEMLKKMNFLGFSIFSFCAVILLNVFNVFIGILANEEYLLTFDTVILIVLNFYITGLRISVSNMKIAAGLFDIDKYTPIIQSIINVSLSILLARVLGLNGVLIGTFISSIFPSVQRPFIVYKYVLKKSCKEYFVDYFKYFAITLIISLITCYLNSIISISQSILLLIQRLILASIVYILIYLIIFRKNNEFVFYKNMIINFIRRKKYE